MEMQLKDAGIASEQSLSAQAAFELFTLFEQSGEDLFKVIICDYSMPDLDGPNTVKKIRELHNKLGRPQPFIVCASAHNKDIISKTMLKAGADKIYDKPLTAE